jgi:hypothetical protein
MVRKSIKTSVIIINHIFQVSIMLGLVYLQSLTNTSALVMRHLYQRNLAFGSHFLSDLGLIIQSLFLTIMVISAVGYLKKLIEKNNSNFKKFEALLFIIFGMLMLSIIHLNFFKDLLVYGYLIMGFYLVLIIQSMNIRIVEKERNE